MYIGLGKPQHIILHLCVSAEEDSFIVSEEDSSVSGGRTDEDSSSEESEKSGPIINGKAKRKTHTSTRHLSPSDITEKPHTSGRADENIPKNYNLRSVAAATQPTNSVKQKAGDVAASRPVQRRLRRRAQPGRTSLTDDDAGSQEAVGSEPGSTRSPAARRLRRRSEAIVPAEEELQDESSDDDRPGPSNRATTQRSGGRRGKLRPRSEGARSGRVDNDTPAQPAATRRRLVKRQRDGEPAVAGGGTGVDEGQELQEEVDDLNPQYVLSRRLREKRTPARDDMAAKMAKLQAKNTAFLRGERGEPVHSAWLLTVNQGKRASSKSPSRRLWPLILLTWHLPVLSSLDLL